MKENGFTFLKRKKKKWGARKYLSETITDADYADDLVLLGNTPVQAKSLLHFLEQVARGIGLYMNPDKTELTCFNQDGAISSLNHKPLKSVNQFTYLRMLFNICTGKAWTAIYCLTTILKSKFSNKMRILLSCSCVSTTIWLHYLNSNKTLGEKASSKPHKDGACCFEQILKAATYKTAAVRPLTSHLINYPNKMKTSWAQLEKEEQTY